MQHEGSVYSRVLQHSFLYHPKCTRAPFLSWLEHQLNVPHQLSTWLGQQFRYSQQDGSVRVVAARMHDSEIRGGVFVVRVLLNREGVRVCPQEHGVAGRCPFDQSDNACYSHPGAHTQAELGQSTSDQRRSFCLAIGELWPVVDSPSVGDHLGRKCEGRLK